MLDDRFLILEFIRFLRIDLLKVGTGSRRLVESFFRLLA